MESSTGGCNGRVCRNVYPLTSLLARGYRPIRFRALENAQIAEARTPDNKSDGRRPDTTKVEARAEFRPAAAEAERAQGPTS